MVVFIRFTHSEDDLLKVYLIRHGEVAWNRANSYVGRTDLALNETGRKQALSLAEFLLTKQISKIYASDLSRAMETAQIVGDKVGLSVQPLQELREVNYGDWEGLSEEAIAEKYPDIFPEWRRRAAEVRIPGGETFQEVKDRAFPAFQKIAASHSDESIVVVAHKSVNRVLLCSLLGVDVNRYRSIAQENACINTIQVRREDWLIVESINERCFLPEGLK